MCWSAGALQKRTGVLEFCYPWTGPDGFYTTIRNVAKMYIQTHVCRFLDECYYKTSYIREILQAYFHSLVTSISGRTQWIQIFVKS